MPYQGSAQSIGFRNRTVIDPSDRMRQEAQQLQERGREQIRGMETQASQQINELQRIGDLEASNARYELDALSKFSKTIDTFVKDVVVEEAKKREENKYYDDVVSYETQSPEVFEEVKKEVDTSLQRGVELHMEINKEADKAPNPEAQDRVRAVSGEHSRGWQVASLEEKARGFGTHLITELDSSEVRLLDPRTNQPFAIKDARDAYQKDLAMQYIKAEYIKANRGNLSSKLVATKLLPAISDAQTLQRKIYTQNFRNQAATEGLDAEESALSRAFLAKDASADSQALALKRWLQVAPAYYKITSPGEDPNRVARKELSSMIQTILKGDPNRVDSIVSTLENTTIEGHPAGNKPLTELYADEFSAESLKAQAQVYANQKYQADETSKRIEAQSAFDAIEQSLLTTPATPRELAVMAKEFQTKFPNSQELVNKILQWQPAVLGVEQSEAKALELMSQYGGEIPESEIQNLDPLVRDKYQNKIVKNPFGTKDKEAIKDAEKIVTAAIKEARKISTNDSVLYDDALRAQRAAQNMIMPEARKLFQLAKENGQPISEGEAIRLAGGVVADKIEADQENPKSRFYSETGKGFTKFEQETGATGLNKLFEQRKTTYRKAQNLLTKDSNALINNAIISNPTELELDSSGSPKSVFYSLAKLDPKRDAWEILNAQRKKAGLAAVTPPAEAQTLQAVLAKRPDLKVLFNSQPSYQRINRGLQSLGTVSAPNLLKALGFQESGGGNYKAYNADAYGHSNPALGKYQILWTTALGWAQKAGMAPPSSKEAFLNSPQYQEQLAQWAINEYVRQASNRTKDPKIAIRMAAAMWYGGAGSIDLYDRASKETGGRYPSMREYTTSVLNHYMTGS